MTKDEDSGGLRRQGSDRQHEQEEGDVRLHTTTYMEERHQEAMAK
jgi:hypothetical protein